MEFTKYFNLYGIPVIAIILIPNIIFAIIDKEEKTDTMPLNRGLKAFEQIGRITVIFFMICSFGIIGDGFLSQYMRNFWIITTAFLLVLYIVCFVFYYRSRAHALAMALAIVPSVIFILTGLLEQDPPLLMFAIIFAIGHIYVTSKTK